MERYEKMRINKIISDINLYSLCIVLCKVMVFGVIIAWTYQNIMTFNSFQKMSFIEDDLEFQRSLRHYQQEWQSLFQARNDFGYGWIYWTFMSIMNFPFYWLFQMTGMDLPLCCFPRLLQMCMTCLTMLYLYKFLCLYIQDILLCCGGGIDICINADHNICSI